MRHLGSLENQASEGGRTRTTGQPHPHAVLGAVLLSNSYALAMFSRTSGTAFVPALAASLHAELARVSIVATVFFWIYGLMQLPAGVLADVFGARRLAALGGVAIGIGSLCFAGVHTLGVALVARAVVAIGCSVVFISMMRHVRTHWTDRRVATISGRCILVGNLGAIASAGPLSYLLAFAEWRVVSAGLGLVSLLIATVLWCVMSDEFSPSPQAYRFDVIAAQFWVVAWNPYNHIGLLMMAGLAGSYYGLASLWLMPWLGARGVPSAVAAVLASLLIAGFASGACVLGWLGDRSGRRWTLAAACSGAVVCWSLLTGAAALGDWTLGALLFALGFCSGGFNLVYALVTERNAVAHSGMATAFINVGIFLGAGTVQSISNHLYVANHGDVGVVLRPMLTGSLMAALLSLSLLAHARRDFAA
jgi:MFS family permease